MWQSNYTPSEDQSHIGLLVSIYNSGGEDEFTYMGSVNLSSNESLNDFINQAKKNKEMNENKKRELVEFKNKISSIVDMELNR